MVYRNKQIFVLMIIAKPKKNLNEIVSSLFFINLNKKPYRKHAQPHKMLTCLLVTKSFNRIK